MPVVMFSELIDALKTAKSIRVVTFESFSKVIHEKIDLIKALLSDNCISHIKTVRFEPPRSFPQLSPRVVDVDLPPYLQIFYSYGM
jgi:hypothetical protein